MHFASSSSSYTRSESVILSLSLSQNDTVYYVRPLVLLFGGRIRTTRVCHALALF